MAAALALGGLLAFAPTERGPADAAAYRAALASARTAAGEALASLRAVVAGSIGQGRDGAAATVSGSDPPGPLLEAAAQRLDDGRPTVDRTQAALAALRGQLAIGGVEDGPRLLVSDDDLASIGAQLRGAADAADAFASMRLATGQVLDSLSAVLVALRGGDPGDADAALADGRSALDRVRAWPGQLATLPIWMKTADGLLDALGAVAAARHDGDRQREARALAAYQAASADAAQADRALAIAIAEGGGAVAQAPLSRLADLLAKIDAARAAVETTEVGS